MTVATGWNIPFSSFLAKEVLVSSRPFREFSQRGFSDTQLQRCYGERH